MNYQGIAPANRSLSKMTSGILRVSYLLLNTYSEALSPPYCLRLRLGFQFSKAVAIHILSLSFHPLNVPKSF